MVALSFGTRLASARVERSRAGLKIRESEMGTRLYVGNLSFQSTADTVRSAFSEQGEVTDVHLVTDRIVRPGNRADSPS
jgi:RNA recognition motif-containing protein